MMLLLLLLLLLLLILLPLLNKNHFEIISYHLILK
jgi:hypothetical protein